MKLIGHISRRRFIKSSAVAGTGLISLSRYACGETPANDVNLGFISCGGRARSLLTRFSRLPGTNVAALCDADASRVDSVSQNYPRATTTTDMRAVFDDPAVDAVVISTCNHWHCLAAIWAMQAGKDVYVEKPLSHSQWEGMQTVAAARRFGRVCQLGTQQRSDPMQAEIKQFLHRDQVLGEIQSVRVNRYGVRPSIGRRQTPLPWPAEVDKDLWLGPAQDLPILRDNLHYDWHWVWNTGCGEMGNWGVHVLDDVRNNVFLDQVKLPRRIFGGGGRVLWADAGETPNFNFVFFDTGRIPVVIGLANIVARPGADGSPDHSGPGTGYTVYCEGGRYEGQRGKGAAFDASGKLIREFAGDSGNRFHQQNFIDAVRQQDSSILNSEVQAGHDSTGWCNLANITYRVGGEFTWEAASQFEVAPWKRLLEEMQATAQAHDFKLDDPSIQFSPLLEVDVEQERFVGDHAEIANAFLKREYREPYTVPDILAQT